MSPNQETTFVSRYGPSKKMQVWPFYDAFICLSMDVFWDRRQVLYLPHTFTDRSVKTLRQVMEYYSYSLVQQVDKAFVMSALDLYEQHHGTDAAWDLISWIRDAGHVQASWCYKFISEELSRLHKAGSINQAPQRLQRLRHLERALMAEYFESDTEFVMTESPWDERMVALQEHDYFGTMENDFNPGYCASSMVGNLYVKIAWENACQGNRPSQAEMDSLNEWVRSTDRYAREEDLNAFWLDPRLRAEYVRRGIVRE